MEEASNIPESLVNRRDPMLIALQFNECINNRNLAGLARLMTDDHTFTDRDGNVRRSKQVMVKSWQEFFDLVPRYKNIFERIQSKDNTVTILGHAYWSDEQPHDSAIWFATVVGDLVREWWVIEDTPENRARLDLL